MKVGSNTRPTKQFNIEERENGKVAVIFFTNIEETQKDEEKYYSYDMFIIETQNQENLENRISNNYDLWLEFAQNQEIEKLSNELRHKRDMLLAETDWTQMQDVALSEEKKEKYRIYRQALRDVPEQEGFPYNAEFPVLDKAGE